MNLRDAIVAYLDANPRAREVSIQSLADGDYEVTLTDLARHEDAETPRGRSSSLDEAMRLALDMEEVDP